MDPDLKATLKQIASGQARHLVTAAAGALMTAGWLASGKESAFVDAGMSALALVGVLGWSAGEKLWALVKVKLALPTNSGAVSVVAAAERAAPVVERVIEPALTAEAAKYMGNDVVPPVDVEPPLQQQFRPAILGQIGPQP